MTVLIYSLLLAGSARQEGIWISFSPDEYVLIEVSSQRHPACARYQARGKFVAQADEIRPQYLDPDTSSFAIFSAGIVRDLGPMLGAGEQLATDNLPMTTVGALAELASPWYSDQILPFDITLACSNEYGALAGARILGVEILNEGTGVLIDYTVTGESLSVQPPTVTKTTSLPPFSPFVTFPIRCRGPACPAPRTRSPGGSRHLPTLTRGRPQAGRRGGGTPPAQSFSGSDDLIAVLVADRFCPSLARSDNPRHRPALRFGHALPVLGVLRRPLPLRRGNSASGALFSMDQRNNSRGRMESPPWRDGSQLTSPVRKHRQNWPTEGTSQGTGKWLSSRLATLQGSPRAYKATPASRLPLPGRQSVRASDPMNTAP